MALFLVSIPNSGLAQYVRPGFEPPQATDSRFVSNHYIGDADAACYHQISGPPYTATPELRYEIPITRVVTTDNGVDSQGQLVGKEAMVSSGVIGPTATLTIAVYDTSYCTTFNAYCLGPPPAWIPASDKVEVNGCPVGTITSQANKVTKIRINFDPICLRFARRQGNGADPIPGVNIVKITPKMQTYSDGKPRCGGEVRITELGPASLEFEAMAPVLMVHGIHSDASWFQALGFETAFQNAKVPYKILGEGPQRTLGNGTIEFVGQNALVRTVEQARREFGTAHVHMVAHSKGGLWSRHFIKYSAAPELSIFTLTTLDTPHQGSVGADLARIARDDVRPVVLSSDLTLLEKVAARFSPYSDSVPDLTTANLRGYNALNGNLPKRMTIDDETNSVKYWAVWADNNKNGSLDANGYGIIECGTEGSPNDECDFIPRSYGFGLAKIDIPPAMYSLMQKYTEAWVYRDTSGRARLWVKRTGPPYPLNDFIVTKDSAQHSEFKTIGQWSKNHRTIGDSAVGAWVRAFLKVSLERELRQGR